MQNMSGGKTALGLDANVGAMLCYLPVCGISLIYSIIVLVTDKANRVVRFHAFQSLLLLGAYIVVVIALMVVSAIMSQISGVLGGLFGMLPVVVALGFIALSVFGCIKGYQNAEFKLPVIGDMADKWSNS
jgi:uncharacterized membrane protein